jgi:hypothetical protein
MSWLARLYDRRIVNVNVNIIVAGLAAMGITVGVMHIADQLGVFARIEGWLPERIRTIDGHLFGHAFQIQSQKLIISGLTFIVDLIADVGVYFGLHWLANHMPRKTPRLTNPAYADLSFMRDASLVQFERAILSPLLYIVALGLQNTLMHHGVGIGKATAIGFSAGILTSRTLHTIWMAHNERKNGQKTATSVVKSEAA